MNQREKPIAPIDKKIQARQNDEPAKNSRNEETKLHTRLKNESGPREFSPHSTLEVNPGRYNEDLADVSKPNSSQTV